MFIVIILETKHSCFQIIIHLRRYRLECKKTNFFKDHVLEMNSMKPFTLISIQMNIREQHYTLLSFYLYKLYMLSFAVQRQHNNNVCT